MHNSIEQDADIVVFIYREDKYEEDSERKGIAEIIVAKHRNGPVGTVNLRFFDRTARFADRNSTPDRECEVGEVMGRHCPNALTPLPPSPTAVRRERTASAEDPAPLALGDGRGAGGEGSRGEGPSGSHP